MVRIPYIPEWLFGTFFIDLPASSSTISGVLSVLEAVGTQHHLSRYLSAAGTQSAVFRVKASTTEQQRLLLKVTVSTPWAVGRENMVHTLSHAGAAYSKPKKNGKLVYY